MRMSIESEDGLAPDEFHFQNPESVSLFRDSAGRWYLNVDGVRVLIRGTHSPADVTVRLVSTPEVEMIPDEEEGGDGGEAKQ